MAYATQSDIENEIGLDQLKVLADRDGDDAVDTAVVTRALDDASAEMDTYLRKRYQLPLAETPTYLRKVCVDLAIYNLADSMAMMNDTWERRHKMAVDWLNRLAKGVVELDLATLPASETNAVHVDAADRVFTRDDTKGIL